MNLPKTCLAYPDEYRAEKSRNLKSWVDRHEEDQHIEWRKEESEALRQGLLHSGSHNRS